MSLLRFWWSAITLLAGACAHDPQASPIAQTPTKSVVSSTPVIAPPSVINGHLVEEWQQLCRPGANPIHDQQCVIRSFLPLADGSIFAVGGHYGSARVGDHEVPKGAFESGLIAIFSPTGDVRALHSLGASWHNEVRRVIRLDDSRVLTLGEHANNFSSKLPARVLPTLILKGVKQDVGDAAEEDYVAVWNNDGTTVWMRNTVFLATGSDVVHLIPTGGTPVADVGSEVVDATSDGSGGVWLLVLTDINGHAASEQVIDLSAAGDVISRHAVDLSFNRSDLTTGAPVVARDGSVWSLAPSTVKSGVLAISAVHEGADARLIQTPLWNESLPSRFASFSWSMDGLGRPILNYALPRSSKDVAHSFVFAFAFDGSLRFHQDLGSIGSAYGLAQTDENSHEIAVGIHTAEPSSHFELAVIDDEKGSVLRTYSGVTPVTGACSVGYLDFASLGKNLFLRNDELFAAGWMYPLNVSQCAITSAHEVDGIAKLKLVTTL